MLTPDARAALEVVAAQIDFTPVLPCGDGRGFVVTSVIGGTLPGTPPQRRVSFIAERSGERAYVLSETRAPVTFTQIPQSTHRLRVAAGEVVAEGFAGPSGSGGETAYLRWRIDGVTYELDATLGRALKETDVRQIAMAFMLRASAQSGAPATPPATTSGSATPLEPARPSRRVW